MGVGLKHSKIIGLISCYAMIWQSCGSSGTKHPTISASTSTIPVVADPTYTDNIKKLIDSNCVSCHDGKATDNKIDLTTYDSVKNNATAISTVTKYSHHQITWTTDIQQLFQNWVTGGFKEGTVATVPDKTTAPVVNVTYAKEVTATFSKCATCHVDDKWSPPLATYAEVKTFGGFAVQWISAAGTHSGVTWTDAASKVFSDWVAGGYAK